jgi:spore coat protein H
MAAACSRAANQGANQAAQNWPAVSPDSNLFEDTNIIRISITVPRSGVRTLDGDDWRRRRGKERPEVTATVTEGDRVYTNVALHLKGAAGSFRRFDDRPALTLNFDKFAKGQRFHGLQKLSLNNSVQDPTYLNEKISRELFNAAGVPVPRSDYAVVNLNGRELGLYVLVEGYNKQFLKRHFKNVSGNLYDGGFLQEITNGLEVNSGDRPNDRSDLEKLAAAAYAARQSGRLEDLAEVLDVDRFLSMFAMEVIQCHWDGYALNRNNYRVFHDLDSGRMIFMPHGLDQTFGIGDRPDISMPIVPRAAGMVAAAVLSTKEGRSLYIQRMGELRTNVLDVRAIINRIRETERRLRPVLAKVGPMDPSHHEDIVNRLCENIAGRATSIDLQLSAPSSELTFGEDGTAKVAGWRPRNHQGSGSGFRLASTEDGRQALQITASREASASSWRTRVFLPDGRYRFEGYARTRGVNRNGDSGAALRISGSQTRQVLNGDTGWMLLTFQFDVRESNQDVELVCELKGNRGEAWFDASSLRLRRIQ